MTRSISILSLLLCLSASAQTPATSEGRVSEAGPYKSQVRLLEDRPTQALSDKELLESSNQSSYGRALLLRQLAQRGISTGDTAAAIENFEQALALDSLSPLATAQMQLNLGQLYALAGRHNKAIALLEAAIRNEDVSDPALMMSLASAYLQDKQPDNAARLAVRAIKAATNAPLEWSEFAVYAFWQAGRLADAAMWQLQLLNATPDQADLWIQLAALYRSANQPVRALATLQTAALSGVLSKDDDWLTLIQMHVDYGTVDIAAQWLKPLVDARPDAQRWQWYGQLLLRSGDEVAALSALNRWAELEATAASWLEVGELAASLGNRKAAANALGRASATRTELSVRGRALLLLGQVEMERGNIGAAKRAFRQAADYGGVYRAATDWLDFLESSTTVADDDVAVATASVTDSDAIATPPVPQLAVKSVAAVRVFTGNRATMAADLVETTTDLATGLIRASRRERLEWTGPLHVIVNGNLATPDAPINVAVAAPISRLTPPRGEFKFGQLEPFRCVWQQYEGPTEGLEAAWQALYAQTLAAGFQPTQEARQIVLQRGNRRSNSKVELQIGIL